MTEQLSPAARLRALIAEHPGDGSGGPLVMPCCFDALSARLGLPDTGLISYGEMLE